MNVNGIKLKTLVVKLGKKGKNTFRVLIRREGEKRSKAYDIENLGNGHLKGQSKIPKSLLGTVRLMTFLLSRLSGEGKEKISLEEYEKRQKLRRSRFGR